jgi:hypothetical protein
MVLHRRAVYCDGVIWHSCLGVCCYITQLCNVVVLHCTIFLYVLLIIIVYGSTGTAIRSGVASCSHCHYVNVMQNNDDDDVLMMMIMTMLRNFNTVSLR